MKHLNKEDIKMYIDAGFTYPEIAEAIGVSRNSIASYCQRWKIHNPNYMKRLIKYPQVLVQNIFEAWATTEISYEELAKKYNVSLNELKCIFIRGYRLKIFKNYRRDVRSKRSWELEETLMLLQFAGLMSRKAIAARIGRCTYQGLKDKMKGLGLQTRYVNGITSHLWGNSKLKDYCIKTKAGSPGPNGNTNQKLILWIDLERLFKKNSYYPMIRAMANFQKFIWQTKSKKEIKQKIMEVIENG